MRSSAPVALTTHHLVDVEKIKSANAKADKEAKVADGALVINLSLAQCVEIHIRQNKENIITFLKQTIDKIFPVGCYLRDKILSRNATLGYPARYTTCALAT